MVVCARRDPWDFGAINRLFSRLTTPKRGDWGFKQRNLTQWGISRLARYRGTAAMARTEIALEDKYFQQRGRYATAGRSLRSFVAFERVVVLFVILAGLVQLFRAAAHMAERAAFLFFLRIFGLGR